jgi:kynurenine formamidase
MSPRATLKPAAATAITLFFIAVSGCGASTDPQPSKRAAAEPSATPPPLELPGGRLVDLSHSYDADTIYWPTKWLVERRRPNLLGIDTPSIDYGQSTRFESHVTLFEADVPALENLAALERLPEVGFHVIALPMKIGDGTGGPVRVVAIVR